MQSGFFLGANSKNGFCSKYHELRNLKEAERVFIIKGSPGCGKSTLMRKVSAHLDTEAENIYCSSDPDSLDAVIFPKLGVALVDGTSPHVVEPTYPLAVEEYINLSEFLKSDEVEAHRDKIIETTDRYKSKFSRAYRLISCSGVLQEDIKKLAENGFDKAQLIKKAKGIVSRELRPTGKHGAKIGRFLSAISPKGYITLYDTVVSLSDRIVALHDTYGIGETLLSAISADAVALGHTVYECYSPLSPERLEHLILPDARLSFITLDKKDLDVLPISKRMHLDSLLDQNHIRANRGKLRFGKSLSRDLIEAACDELKAGKLVHDELEALYHPCIDFEKVDALAETLANRISAK